jgi:hypothetical protein
MKDVINKFKHLALSLLVSLSVLSCGGSSVLGASAGISGTGIVFGIITGFGSIFVNGVEYEIEDANFNVDGNIMASQADLKIGMVVRLDATNNGDGTGEAISVVYDEIIEGPISSLMPTSDPDIKTFEVFDTTVNIDASSTIFIGTSFATIQNDEVIEVSGFINQSGEVIATLVEYQEDLQQGSEVELHGQIEVSSLILNQQFVINGVTINYTFSTPLEDLENGLSEGLYVEVKGLYNAGEIDAVKIEGEDDDREEIEQSEGEVSVQGIITDFTDSLHFDINGIPVQVDAAQVPASILNQLQPGLEIEVEGDIENGIIMADEIELRQDERKYKALVSSVNTTNQTISIYFPNTGTIELSVDGESELEDDITLSALNFNDEVKIEASINGNEIRVKSLKRETLEEFEISGVVEAFEEDVSVTIDGLLLPLAVSVQYQPSNLPSLIVPGITVVELKDDVLKDGIFEEVELED